MQSIVSREDLFDDSLLFEIGVDGVIPTSLVFLVHFSVTEDTRLRRRYSMNVAEAARHATDDAMMTCAGTRAVLFWSLLHRFAKLDPRAAKAQTAKVDLGGRAAALDARGVVAAVAGSQAAVLAEINRMSARGSRDFHRKMALELK
jgi:hypothetical protein